MAIKSYSLSETQRKRLTRQRIFIVHGALLLALLIIVSRLLELQVVKGSDYRSQAQSQHYGGVVLPAKRGIIYSRNSKTNETSILATNTTLDMVYVDPLITDQPTYLASELSHVLLTDEFHALCSTGKKECPTELSQFYAAAFDPTERIAHLQSGALLEPMSGGLPAVDVESLPDIEDVRRTFANDIEKRISQKRVTFVPLVYGATKIQMNEVRKMGLDGVYVVESTRIIFADPEEIAPTKIASIARQLEPFVDMDDLVIRRLLRSRPLRYVPIMNKLPPELSLKIRELKSTSFQETNRKKSNAASRTEALDIKDPMRSVALIPEHWRYYPDGRVGSNVVGFLNAQQEPQYGIERTFNLELRGQEGLISTVSDLEGGQILTANQTIIDARDGDNIVLTIDRFVQKKVEEIMDDAVKRFEANSGQAIVMDPFTGRIIAMVNAPTFDSNSYGTVYNKEPIYLDKGKQDEIVAEIYHPITNQFVVKMFLKDLYSEDGRFELSEKTNDTLIEIESMYDLEDIMRYYLYIGENNRIEIFPTDRADFWLKYTNTIGVGAYLNRTIQEIYEPGSVFKPITMAIAIDQGEVSPEDEYMDTGTVKVDEYTIKNALNARFGEVNMVNCLEYSINTCMTSVSVKLGKKLFHRMIERFGFGKITNVELEDELPGEILPWMQWSKALLATAAYGQGISATPLQVITGWSALANGGKLIRPTIIDSVIKSDGTVQKSKTVVIDQVITKETSDTISAMLTSVVSNGYGKSAKVPGYQIAGKTGTSQIAGPGGKYESGTGSSVTSFAGYAPANHAKFVLLVKFDRPRAVDFGSESGAPVFKEIASFLFDYYGIPPTEE